MTCPQQDGELVKKTITRPGDTPLEYGVCPTCGGHFLRAFDANFLPPPLEDQARETASTIPSALICPTCGFKLVRATGANIPEHVLAFRCRQGHGYFFPAGELLKFKSAQEAKITYHKLWEIPIPSVAATLLTAIFGIILSLGLILGVIEGQRRQASVSQAKNLISFHKAYVSETTKSVTFIVTTSVETSLAVHIEQTQYVSNMQTTDRKSHVLRVTNLPRDEYNYYFTLVIEGKPIRSETYSFQMP